MNTLQECHQLRSARVQPGALRGGLDRKAHLDVGGAELGAGRLEPEKGTPERLRFTYWLHFAEGSAMSPLLMKLVFDRIETSPMPFFAKPIARGISRKVKTAMVEPNLKRHLDHMERELTKSEWFAGDEFTAADIQMSFPVEASAQRAGLDASRPKLMTFLKKIHARPAFRRALERGGPYSFAND